MQDVYIACIWDQARYLAADLDALFTASARQNPGNQATVLAHGETQVHAEGFVVVEWVESAPASFLEKLKRLYGVTDYSVYSVSRPDRVPVSIGRRER